MELLATVEAIWGWTGLRPAQIIGDNEFGNLIIKDTADHYWRICPEELSCGVIATSRVEFNRVSHDQVFLRDWYMTDLVQLARQRMGPLRPGFRYCLKISSSLGGEYGGENFATISFIEFIAVSGKIAKNL